MTTYDHKAIAAAKECGFAEWENTDSPEFLAVIAEFYSIAFEAGRVAEREECAMVCEALPSLWPTERVIADECSSAIRARSAK